MNLWSNRLAIILDARGLKLVGDAMSLYAILLMDSNQLACWVDDRNHQYLWYKVDAIFEWLFDVVVQLKSQQEYLELTINFVLNSVKGQQQKHNLWFPSPLNQLRSIVLISPPWPLDRWMDGWMVGDWRWWWWLRKDVHWGREWEWNDDNGDCAVLRGLSVAVLCSVIHLWSTNNGLSADMDGFESIFGGIKLQ